MSNKNIIRLTGGADSLETPEEGKASDENGEQNISTENIEVQENNIEDVQSEIKTESVVDMKDCPTVEQIETGDKKVDELIEYIQKNLREVCESLANLGDNIEHEIKLMFVDVIGRIRKWVSNTEDKIDKSMGETKTLQKEFKIKMESLAMYENDIESFKKQLAEAEEAKLSLSKSFSKSQRSLKQNKELGSEIIIQEEKHSEQKGKREFIGNEVKEGLSKNSEPPSTQPRDSEMDENSGLSRVSSKIDNRIHRHKLQLEPSQREIELEKEIECLKKENERLIKERTEYENAVQRALLKGVSSLNVEALKVMRNPPTCYNPSGPSSTLIEPLIPCGSRNVINNSNRSNTSNYSESQTPKKNHAKKTCTNANCPSAKHHRKTLVQNLLLLNDKNTTC